MERRPSAILRTAARFIPALEWIPAYRRENLPGDLVAGTIVAVMLVPQGMAYAMLAGLPPEVGLYASALPLVIYGLLGTSRALGVGPTAIASLLTASGVNLIATEGTEAYLQAAVLLTFMVGVIRAVLGFVRAGFLVNFMSRPVLSGFVNAAALMIAASQIAPLVGIEAERASTFFGQSINLLRATETFNVWTALVGAGSVIALLYAQRYLRVHLAVAGIPDAAAQLIARTGPLLTAAAATLIVWLASLHDGQNVPIVGEVRSGLPPVVIPQFDLQHIQVLLPTAAVIAIVGFMESITIAKSLASRERERVDADQELVAVGAANIGSAFTGGFTVTGSFSRSVVNHNAGARTGLASIVTGLIVVLSLVLLTPLFYYLPRATLAAIVVVALSSLFETYTFRRVWAYRRADAVTLIVTFALVLILGIEVGLLAGIASSVALFLWRTSHPAVVELGKVRGTDIYRNLNRHDADEEPGMLLLRIDESLYFANTQHLQDVIRAKVRERPEINHLVIVGSAINDIDASALETLEELVLQLSAGGITVHVAAFKLTILERLRGTLLLQLIGSDRIHMTVNDAVDVIRYGQQTVDATDQDAKVEHAVDSRVEDA